MDNIKVGDMMHTILSDQYIAVEVIKIKQGWFSTKYLCKYASKWDEYSITYSWNVVWVKEANLLP